MGEWRDIARKTLARISDEMPGVVQELHAQGVPKAEIARMARISRPALDAMLKK